MPFRSASALCSFIVALVLALPALADDGRSLILGGDAYLSGDDITATEPTAGDLFIAGGDVDVTAPVAGSAHLLGRDVSLSAPVEGDLYGAGKDVTVGATVSGSASLFGYAVEVDSGIGGNLRAAGNRVRVGAPVAGSALIGAEDVYLDAAIAGDVRMAAEDIEFGEGAAIGGSLTLYSDSLTVADIPQSVVAADRVTVETSDRWQDGRRWGPGSEIAERAVWAGIGSFLTGVIMVALIVALIAGVAPEALPAMRERVLGEPGRSFGFGFLALSAAIGSGIVLAITGIGLLLVPVALLAVFLLWLGGYVIAAYTVGAALWAWIRRDPPIGVVERMLAGAIGALVVGLLALIPIIGWLFVVGIVIVGAGALTIRLFRPAFL